MAHRADVAFLADANPALIERNADEFARLHRLADSTDDAFLKAGRVDWVSTSQQQYVKRLDEAKQLVDGLSAGFRKAWQALADYAEAVTTAQRHFDDGEFSERKLAEVVAREATLLTRLTGAESPMREWEDLRDSSGLLDRIGEFGVDVDAIREDAERHYQQANDAYGDAQRVESEARSRCLAELRTAYASLPEFRGGSGDSAEILGSLGLLREETRQAADDPHAQLPGTGVKADAIPSLSDALVVNEKLERIRSLAAEHPDAKGISYLLPSDSEETLRGYVDANSALIRAAAHHSGLPPEMVAGIAWQEVGGAPAVVDDVADEVRQLVPGTGEADHTSMGPLAVQVRRGAEVLGYDPHHLTDHQRARVEEAIKDPAQNVFIASEYLAQMKAESGFADVPAEQMTRAQMQELAARYNGGPYWQSDDAQAYARRFDARLDEATAPLR
ncbi:hypothetical protein E4198_09700 [Streptomyces sp. RKND-216]|uniref:lytic transglycosylase domain-containing protein n=1 Tax=Streptomyces sp. RKND-216 TaxID=2562581 RepID=UPI00109DD894|nr:lytic transglycosylase domain-containing protein [Streptomyces sp. RKND-216]THA24964.1 hypothetical protein E4198_09700 [Streptomyces sp. RKND-216]